MDAHMECLRLRQKILNKESLLLWHVATEICRNIKGEDGKIDLYCNRKKENKYQGISKHLSDYMLYLLIHEPAITSSVAGIGQIKFKDTCAHAEIFFRQQGIMAKKTGCGKRGEEELQEAACREILDVRTDFESITLKEDSSKSVLFDACKLAKKLEEVGRKRDKWEIMSKVWVEMLSYAACRCRAKTHAAELGKGGQLITLVRMLMAHLGIRTQFQMGDFHPRTTLAVDK